VQHKTDIESQDIKFASQIAMRYRLLATLVPLCTVLDVILTVSCFSEKVQSVTSVNLIFFSLGRVYCTVVDKF